MDFSIRNCLFWHRTYRLRLFRTQRMREEPPLLNGFYFALRYLMNWKVRLALYRRLSMMLEPSNSIPELFYRSLFLLPYLNGWINHSMSGLRIHSRSR